MAFKFRIGNFVIINLDKDAAADPAHRIEEHIEQLEVVVESKIKNWIRNDRFFDGLRNTPARVLLWVLGNVALYAGLAICLTRETGLVAYAIVVTLTVVAQKLSVRFVFDSDAGDIVDEYQRTRRDRSYRRAYRNVTGAFVGLVAVILFYGYVAFYFENGYLTLWPTAFINLHIDSYRVLSVLIFLAGFFTLQPYGAWGFKGEPMRSKDVPND
jgi:hypothetical protein